jgi:hypothetical protein
MAIDYDGTDYHLTSTTPVTAVPLTMACWFNPDVVSALDYLICIADSGADTDWFSLEANGAAGDVVRARTNATTGVFASTSATFVAGTWQHAAAVFESTTSRAAYLDGGNKGTNTTSKTPSGLDRIGLACQATLTPTLFLSGLIAEAAIWDVALTDDEVAQLGLGYCPLLVRPDGLVFYAPLVRAVQDVIGGLTLTATGTPAAAVHPRIIYPARKRFSFPTAAAPGGDAVPVAWKQYRQRRIA